MATCDIESKSRWLLSNPIQNMAEMNQSINFEREILIVWIIIIQKLIALIHRQTNRPTDATDAYNNSWPKCGQWLANTTSQSTASPFKVKCTFHHRIVNGILSEIPRLEFIFLIYVQTTSTYETFTLIVSAFTYDNVLIILHQLWTNCDTSVYVITVHTTFVIFQNYL